MGSIVSFEAISYVLLLAAGSDFRRRHVHDSNRLFFRIPLCFTTDAESGSHIYQRSIPPVAVVNIHSELFSAYVCTLALRTHMSLSMSMYTIKYWHSLGINSDVRRHPLSSSKSFSAFSVTPSSSHLIESASTSTIYTVDLGHS